MSNNFVKTILASDDGLETISNLDGVAETASASDEVVETASKTWFEKIIDGIKGIFFGLILVIVSGFAIFWNEGRSAETFEGLAEGAKIVISISGDKIDIANEGKLVHVAAETSTSQPLKDSDFGFLFEGLKLSRTVEMYQWKETTKSETHKKLGGGEEKVTYYTYALEWSSNAINSNNFKNSADHKNPPFPALVSKTYSNQTSKIGAFSLGQPVLDELDTYEKFPLQENSLNKARAKLGPKASIRQGEILVANNPDTPVLGDIKISYQIIPIKPISLVANQFQSTFSPYVTTNGHKLLLVEPGLKDSAILFKDERDENRIITWVVRGGAFFLMFVGFCLMLTLLEILADVIPFLGDIVGAGSLFIGLCFTLITAPTIAAIAWFFYRPLIGGSILLGSALLLFGVRAITNKQSNVAKPL